MQEADFDQRFSKGMQEAVFGHGRGSLLFAAVLR